MTFVKACLIADFLLQFADNGALLGRQGDRKPQDGLYGPGNGRDQAHGTGRVRTIDTCKREKTKCQKMCFQLGVDCMGTVEVIALCT